VSPPGLTGGWGQELAQELVVRASSELAELASDLRKHLNGGWG